MPTNETNAPLLDPEAHGIPLDFLKLVEVEASSVGSVALLYSEQTEAFGRDGANGGLLNRLAHNLSRVSGISRPAYGSHTTEIVSITPPIAAAGASGARQTRVMLRFAKPHGPLEAAQYEQDDAGHWQHIQTGPIDADTGLRIKKGSSIVYGVVDENVDRRAANARSYHATPRLQSLLEQIKLSNESPLHVTSELAQRSPRKGFLQRLITRPTS